MTEGLTHFATRAAALRFERAAKAGLVSEAKARKGILHAELTYMLDTLQSMLDCGVAKDAIAEALAGLMDAIVNADYAACKTIDEAGEYSETLDMTEAAALLERVKS